MLIQITMHYPTLCILTYSYRCFAVSKRQTPHWCTGPIEIRIVCFQRPIMLTSPSLIKRDIRMLIIPARERLLGSLGSHRVGHAAYWTGCCLGAVLLCCGIIVIDILPEAVCCLGNRLCVAVTACTCVGCNTFLCTGDCFCDCGCVIMYMSQLSTGCSSCILLSTDGAYCSLCTVCLLGRIVVVCKALSAGKKMTVPD